MDSMLRLVKSQAISCTIYSGFESWRQEPKGPNQLKTKTIQGNLKEGHSKDTRNIRETYIGDYTCSGHYPRHLMEIIAQRLIRG